MRDKLVNGLNELLEIDHDSVADLMTRELQLVVDSDLNPHPAAYSKAGVRVVSALGLINQCLDGTPIRAVFEGEVIQRFE